MSEETNDITEAKEARAVIEPKPELKEAQKPQAIVPAPQKAQLALKTQGLVLNNIDEVYRLAQWICKSEFAPKNADATSVTLRILKGQEIGLPPLAAVQNIAVINGRPAVYGDVMLGLIRASGLLASFSEEAIGERGKDSFGYRCTAVRVKGDKSAQEFTVYDAKAAGKWGSPGPWSSYPLRMLQMRARSWALRDLFADVLNGMTTIEEARDIVDIESQVIEPSIESMTGGLKVEDAGDKEDGAKESK